MQERQSMESHQKKILSSTRRNTAVVAFMPTRCQTQLISELFAFLGHLQHMAIDSFRCQRSYPRSGHQTRQATRTDKRPTHKDVLTNI